MQPWIEEAIELRESGMKIEDIAKRFHKSPNTVANKMKQNGVIITYDQQIYGPDWYAENEARAQQAMREAGIWYRKPHIPPYAIPSKPGTIEAPVYTTDQIVRAVSEITSISEQKVREGKAVHEVVARKVVVYVIRQLTKWTFPKIAEEMGVSVTTANQIANHYHKTGFAGYGEWIDATMRRLGQ